VQLDHLPGDREAQLHARQPPVIDHHVELVKEVRLVLRRDAGAIVDDGHLEASRRFLHADIDVPLPGREGDGIRQDVGQDLFHPPSIHHHHVRRVQAVDPDDLALALSQRAEGLHDAADDLLQIGPLGCQGDLAGVELGDLQQVVDQDLQAAHVVVDGTDELGLGLRWAITGCREQVHRGSDAGTIKSARPRSSSTWRSPAGR
jgi:hypothetical protein